MYCQTLRSMVEGEPETNSQAYYGTDSYRLWHKHIYYICHRQLICDNGAKHKEVEQEKYLQ